MYNEYKKFKILTNGREVGMQLYHQIRDTRKQYYKIVLLRILFVKYPYLFFVQDLYSCHL